MINQYKLLPKGLSLFALILPAFAAAAEAAKPNIIFIISDDHRWDVIGAAGNPNVHTPHIDRLAREGVYFPEATIAMPQCTSSRAVIMTGMATHANGRYSNQTARADILTPRGFEKYDCLPEVLRDQGYATVNIGKWHMETDPWNIGFEKTGTWFPPGSGPFRHALLARGKSREGKRHGGFTQQAFGDSAVDILKQHADEASSKPLFMWFATTAPHGPYGPNPPEAVAPYVGKTEKDMVPPNYKGNVEIPSVRWQEYLPAVTSVDMEVGRIMKTLDETGMSSNTVVVFIGDNGYMMGSRDKQGKAIPYDPSIRVPYIIWGPGVIKAKGKTDAVASSLDLPPTLVKLAGGEIPDSWHGRDLSATLADGKAHGTTWSVTQFMDNQNWKFPDNAYRAVRTTNSKLIVWEKSQGKAPEFYDLVSDPYEEKNLYTDAAVQPRVKELTLILESWMRETGDDWTMKGELTTQGKPGNRRKSNKDTGNNSADD